jgi:hypothetical protein
LGGAGFPPRHRKVENGRSMSSLSTSPHARPELEPPEVIRGPKDAAAPGKPFGRPP